MRKLYVVPIIALAIPFVIAIPPKANADTQCPYPGVGILGVHVGPIGGGFCDFPTEINGAHWHCQGGGFDLGLGILGNGGGGNSSLGFSQSGAGIGGLSCNWKCPDGIDAPAPNPPGMWQHYLVPMDSTNFCKDHMAPNGFWANPVLPTEGVPPEGFVPPPPEPPPPGEPQAFTPGEPNS